MLDINLIRENSNKVKESIRRRGLNVDIDHLLATDNKRRELIKEVENLRAEKNKISRQPACAGRQTVDSRQLGREVKKKLNELEPQLKKIEQEQEDVLMQVPNLLHPETPDGKDDTENVEIRAFGGKPEFDFEAKGHDELGKNLDLIDVKKGAEVAGAGFYYLKNEAVLLEFALIQYGLTILQNAGFVPVVTPEVVRKKAAEGAGFIPRREEPDIYKIENEDLYLVATAEMPLTAYHMNETLKKEELPKSYVGFSSCFRKEAGAYGKHKKGIFRVHEFDKLEMYKFALPEQSEHAFSEMVALEEKIYQGLKIPYRVVNICTGDMSAPAYVKYDLEYWSPAEKAYREITSCSNCTDFQARRLNIKYRKDDGSLDFVHTLNGTAIAIGRTLIAILENYQQEDGSVVVPEVLREYVGKEKIESK